MSLATLTYDPHDLQPVVRTGPAPETAAATLILLHGRGDSAQGILRLYDALAIADVAAVAPEAAGRTWYPYSFLAPLVENQPWLDSAIRKVESIVLDLISRGIPSERIALLGFSQGACLAAEFLARHPRHYGAGMGLTGGLIGPPGTSRDYPGDLAGTSVFLGSGDPDQHVPFERVRETEFVLKHMGATVELRRYPGMPHSINDDELVQCRHILRQLAQTPTEDTR